MLKIDGKSFCQSAALVRYAAHYARLSDCDDLENFTSDMVISTIDEVFEKITMPAFKARMAISESGNKPVMN